MCVVCELSGRGTDQPLVVDLAGADEPSAAQVIEAILHTNPRIAGNVDTLRRRRRSGGSV